MQHIRQPREPIVSMILAISKNGVIGVDKADPNGFHGMPWRLADELENFKRLTRHHTLIMGRVTHEMIGKPLSDRNVIVLSRSPAKLAEVYGATSLDEAIDLAHDLAHDLDLDTRLSTNARSSTNDAPKPVDEIFICGGASVYEAAIERLETISTLHITYVDATIDNGVIIPSYEELKPQRLEISGQWDMIDRISHVQDARNSFAWDYRCYSAKRKGAVAPAKSSSSK